MATTYLAGKAAAGVQPRGGIGLVGQYETYALTAALVANDVIKMFKIPKNARMQEVILAVDDLDAGSGLKLDVGDVDDPDRYIQQTTIGQTSGVARLDQEAGLNYKYTAEGYLTVKVQTAPASAVAEGNIRVSAFYNMDQ